MYSGRHGSVSTQAAVTSSAMVSLNIFAVVFLAVQMNTTVCGDSGFGANGRRWLQKQNLLTTRMLLSGQSAVLEFAGNREWSCETEGRCGRFFNERLLSGYDQFDAEVKGV